LIETETELQNGAITIQREEFQSSKIALLEVVQPKQGD
jgi:hypothetical protein